MESLHLAQFLTFFQSQFAPEDEKSEKPRTISQELLENAFKVKSLEQQYARESGGDESWVKNREKALLEVSIDEFNQRLADIVLAQEEKETRVYPSIKLIRRDLNYTLQLMSRFEVWSTQALVDSLIPGKVSSNDQNPNFPFGNFIQLQHYLPLKKDVTFINQQTWREYLRISLMVSLLYANYDPEAHCREIVDLVNLWLEGQTSVVAWNKLICCLDIEEETNQNEGETKFKVKYKEKENGENNFIDEDAIAHFVNASVESVVSHEMRLMESLKLTENTEVNVNKKEILWNKASAQSIVRWFALRHRPALTKLYSNADDKSHPDRNELRKKVLLRLKLLFGSTIGTKVPICTTLAQVDAQIQSGKILSKNQLKSVVSLILESYMQFLTHDEKHSLAAALWDWQLMVKDESLWSEMLKVERQVSAPWRNSTCIVCGQNFTVKKSIFECFCCKQSIHRDCCKENELQMKERPPCNNVKAGQHLIDAYKKKFTIQPSEPTSWEESDIVLIRNGDETDQSWGVGLSSTEECCDAVEAFEGPWGEYEYGFVTPMKVPQEGLVVDRLKLGGIAQKCGLRNGDVIVAIELSDDVNQAGTSTELPKEYDSKIVLSQLTTKEDRLMYFRNSNFKQIRLTVYRANTDYYEEMTSWVNTTMARSKAVSGLKFDGQMKPIWYCPTCFENVTRPKELSVIDEANCCISILRELSMEWCAQRPSKFNQRGYIIPEFVSLLEDLFKFHDSGYSFSSRPCELLCKGIDNLITCKEDEDEEEYLDEKTALATQFLDLYSCYVLDYHKGVIKSLPQHTQTSLAPWDLMKDEKSILKTEKLSICFPCRESLSGFIPFGSSVLIFDNDECLQNEDTTKANMLSEYIVGCNEGNDHILLMSVKENRKRRVSVDFGVLKRLQKQTSEIRSAIDSFVVCAITQRKVHNVMVLMNDSLIAAFTSLATPKPSSFFDSKIASNILINEYMTCIEALNFSCVPFMRDFVDKVLLSNGDDFIPGTKHTRPAMYLRCPELETDVGETDDDESFTLTPLDDEEGSFVDYLDEFERSKTKTSCRICYADFTVQEERKLKVPELENPAEYEELESEFSVTLCRVKDKEYQYTGFAWGLELYRNSVEHGLRVGRIFPGSIAADSSLQSHDKITHINGIRADNLKNDSAIAKALLLWKEKAALDESKRKKGLGRYPAKTLILKMKGPIDGDLVLGVQRFNAVDKPVPSPMGMHDNQFGQSHEVASHANAMASMIPPSSTLPSQKLPLSSSHLYNHSGIPGCLFTNVEAAVLLEANIRGQPLLGLRLLSPRYDTDFVSNHYNQVMLPSIEHYGSHMIPFITPEQWQALMVADYQRSLSENGPISFSEKGFTYREPIESLPLDRVFEIVLTASMAGLQWNAQDLLAFRPMAQIPQTMQPQPQSMVYSSDLQQASFPQNSVPQQQPYQQQVDPSQANATISNGVGIPPPADLNGQQQLVDGEEPIDLISDDDQSRQNATKKRLQESAPDDEPVKRIRGGGPYGQGNSGSIMQTNTASMSTLLSEFPSSNWVGLKVYGKCLTAESADSTQASEEATFFGHIESVSPSDGYCTVNVVYVDTSGYLQQPVQTSVHSDLLNVATAEDEEQIFLGNRGTLSSPQPQGGSSGLGTTHKIPTYAKTKYSLYKSRKTISMKIASKMLVDRICHRISSAVPLGKLPDGSSVCWIQSDPKALYIRPFVSSETEALIRSRRFRILVKRWAARVTKKKTVEINNKKFCCVWGCTTAVGDGQERELLTFDALDEYNSHMMRCHKYHENIANTSSEYVRLAEGDAILQLCADITAAACTACMDLTKLSTPFSLKARTMDEKKGKLYLPSPLPQRMNFKVEALIDLTEGGRGSAYFSNIVSVLPSTDISTRSLLRLWTRICRLFDIENNGKFRLSEKDCQTSYSKTSLQSEAVVLQEEEEEEDLDVVEGTESPSDLVTVTQDDNSIVADDLILQIKDLKDDLIALANEIPQDLYLDGIGLENFTKWEKCVAKAAATTNLRLVLHFLIYLQKSLDQSRLPKWFNQVKNYNFVSSGYYNCSLSLVSLRLLVLREAILEYTEQSQSATSQQQQLDLQAATTDTTQKHLKKKNQQNELLLPDNNTNTEEVVEQFELQPIEDMRKAVDAAKVEKVLAELEKMPLHKKFDEACSIAEQRNIRRYTGVHCDRCFVCSKGGRLLCCEFCNSCVHVVCLDKSIQGDSEDPDFNYTCYECIDEIVVADVYADQFQDS